MMTKSTHSRIWTLALALLLAACTDSNLKRIGETDDEGGEPVSPGVTPVTPDEEPTLGVPAGSRLPGVPVRDVRFDAPDHRLTIRLDGTPVPGQPVGYDVQILQGPLDVTDAFQIALNAVPTDGVTVETSEVTFLQPGPYTLSARGVSGETVVQGDLVLTVGVGAPATLTVTTNPEVARAGELVDFTITAADAVGNPLDPATLGLDAWLEPGSIPIDPASGEILLTAVGRYELHAETGTGIHGAAVFHIDANDPTFIDLSLEAYEDLNPGDTLDFEVYGEDAYGNPVEDMAVTVTTVPPGPLVDARRIHFDTEGIYDVVARIDGSALEDSEGPILVDGFGPVVEIKSPDRGVIIRTSPVVVQGSVSDLVSGLDRITVNGTEVTPDNFGDFTYNITPALGINMIDIEAFDNEGHSTHRVQSFLYGTSFVPSGNAVSSGIVTRVNQATLDLMEDWVEAEFDATALRNVIMANPRIWYDCIDLWVWEPCAYVDLTGFSMSYLSVAMTPNSAGYVNLYAGIRNPWVGLHIDGDAPSIYGSVYAGWAHVNGRLSLWVDGSNNIRASLTNITFSFESFGINISGLPDWLSFIEDWIADWFQEDVENAIRAQIVAQAPAAVDAALSELELATSIDALGTTVYIDALPASITIDGNGLTMLLNTIVEPDEVDPELVADGALRTLSSTPAFGATPGFVLSISDDFLNQALLAVWEAGSLNRLFEDQVVPSLDTSMLQTLVPGASGFEFEVDPLLPPVFRPRLGWGSIGQFQLGDVLVDLYATFPRGPRQLVARVAVSMFGYASVTIDAANTLLVGWAGDPVFYFDGVMSALPTLRSEDLAGLLDALVPFMMPELLSQVQEFPIPSFEGFTINSPTVTLGGSSTDFINLSGNLRLQ